MPSNILRNTIGTGTLLAALLLPACSGTVQPAPAGNSAQLQQTVESLVAQRAEADQRNMQLQQTVESLVAQRAERPPAPTLELVSDLITGSVVANGGACCVTGKVGDSAVVSVEYRASSRAGRVVEMRQAPGDCGDPARMAEFPWEPFVTSRPSRVELGPGTSAVGFTVQYRDEQGNVSQQYCTSVTLEGEE
ncbi:MAG TPA: hypothetical protein VFS21_27140 [Roseiflexaceae bacterium]|nr:hypothetical protein [Roseiflexaceae bacterium]